MIYAMQINAFQEKTSQLLFSFSVESDVNATVSSLSSIIAGNCGNSNEPNPRPPCSRDKQDKSHCLGVETCSAI